MKLKKIYLFDLDGVLIDSKKNMQLSWNELSLKNNINVPFSNYFSLIGLPFIQILKKLKIKQKYFKNIEYDFKVNSIKNLKYIKIHKGVLKTLKILKKKKKIVGILTSKEKIRTLKILSKLNIKVDLVLCPKRNLIGKPNPKQINDLAKKKRVSKEKIVYIGDMKVDKLTAKNAKVDYIHASYGYSKNVKSKYLINNIYEIVRYNFGIDKS